MPTIFRKDNSIDYCPFFCLSKLETRTPTRQSLVYSSSEERAEAGGTDAGQFRNAVNRERLKTVSSCPPFLEKTITLVIVFFYFSNIYFYRFSINSSASFAIDIFTNFAYSLIFSLRLDICESFRVILAINENSGKTSLSFNTIS